MRKYSEKVSAFYILAFEHGSSPKTLEKDNNLIPYNIRHTYLRTWRLLDWIGLGSVKSKYFFFNRILYFEVRGIQGNELANGWLWQGRRFSTGKVCYLPSFCVLHYGKIFINIENYRILQDDELKCIFFKSFVLNDFLFKFS